MGKVITQASMSLDGFIADSNDQVGPLHDWYGNRDVEVTGSDPNMVFHTSAVSANHLRKAGPNIAADVIGRRGIPCGIDRRTADRPGTGRDRRRRPILR